MNYLDCMVGEYRDNVTLKTAIMGFINAALKYGAGQVKLITSVAPEHFIAELSLIKSHILLRKEHPTRCTRKHLCDVL